MLVISLFVFLVGTLQLFQVPIGQLVLGGAVAGVLLGIAAQQSLANLFAGWCCCSPTRSGLLTMSGSGPGALSGQIEGVSPTSASPTSGWRPRTAGC